MKRILSALAVILVAPLIGNARDGLFKSFAEKMADSFVSMDYNFSAEISGIMTVGKGTVLMQGDCYYHNGSGLELWCDGKSIWTSDSSAKEVVIESFAESSSPYALNPALVLMSPETKFTLAGQKDAGNETEYHLVPKISCGIRDCRIKLSGTVASPLIKSAVIVLGDGTALALTFSNVKFLNDLKDRDFFSPGEFDSSWIITDLR